MNKKKFLVFTILIIMLIIVPAIVLATREKVELPILNDETIEEANQKEMERLLEEKKKFEEENANNESETVTYSTNSEPERDEMIDKALEEVREKKNKREEIIKRYYSEEYTQIKNKIEAENNQEGFVEFDSTLSDNQQDLYELVLRILEEETLTSDDENVLKDYISENMYDLKNDEQLSTRANNLLK